MYLLLQTHVIITNGTRRKNKKLYSASLQQHTQ